MREDAMIKCLTYLNKFQNMQISAIYLQFLDFGQTTKCGIHQNLKKSALPIIIHTGKLVLIIKHLMIT